MLTRKTKGWECERCSTFHADYEDAIDCCTSVTEVDAWQCVKCNEVYDNKEDAIDCCKKGSGD